jgi:hypothetical protein
MVLDSIIRWIMCPPLLAKSAVCPVVVITNAMDTAPNDCELAIRSSTNYWHFINSLSGLS